MKKELMFESLSNFKRKSGVKSSLGIGNARPFKDGDKIKILEDIFCYWPDGYDNKEYTSLGRSHEFKTKKEIDELEIDSLESQVFLSIKNGTILRYNKKDDGFTTEFEYTTVPAYEFLREHPEIFERL